MDLTGKRFGKLTVAKEAGRYAKDKYIKMWICQCDCGNEHITRQDSLQAGRVKSCGCIHSKVDSAFQGLLNSYRGQAKWRRIEWELTEDQFKNLVESPCYYTGRPPSGTFVSVSSRQRSKRGLLPAEGGICMYNGIDRLDSSKGYTLDNCVPSCSSANLAKQSLSHDEFIALCKEIAARH